MIHMSGLWRTPSKNCLFATSLLWDLSIAPCLLKLFCYLFYRIPLVVEVWHKDNMAGNVLIGVCTTSLATALAADKIPVVAQVRQT